MAPTSFSSSNSKGLLMLGGLLVLGALVVFVPEVLNLQEYISGSAPAATAPGETAAPEEGEAIVEEEIPTPGAPPAPGDAAPAAEGDASALDRVIGRIDRGDFDPAPSGGPTPDPADPKGSERAAERAEAAKVLAVRPLTWAILKKPEIQKVISRAYRESQSLLKLVPREKVASRRALLSFMNGLHFFSRKEAEATSPEEALGYLGDLDVGVTQAFAEEGVGRTEYDVWRVVSLGPLVVRSGADRAKNAYNPPFKADIVLTRVRVTERPARDARGPRRMLYDVDADGAVLTGDAEAMEIYVGGRFESAKALKKSPPGRPWVRVPIRLTQVPAGKVTVRFVGDKGGISQKTYSFVQGAKRHGRYVRGSYTTPHIDGFDPTKAPDGKVDALFRAGSDGSGVAGTGYEEFTTGAGGGIGRF